MSLTDEGTATRPPAWLRRAGHFTPVRLAAQPLVLGYLLTFGGDLEDPATAPVSLPIGGVPHCRVAFLAPDRMTITVMSALALEPAA